MAHGESFGWFFYIHHLVDRARAATCYPAVRAGFPSRDGAESNRRLATETPSAAFRGRDPGDADADFGHYDHHPVRHPAAEPTTAGTHAQHPQYVARHPDPDRVPDEKLS